MSGGAGPYDGLSVVEEVARQGFIRRPEGLRVWVLGAHTACVDERQWGRLKAFWTEHFRRAQAELVAFTPSSRLAEQ